MAEKFLVNQAGTVTEREATVVSAGAGDDGNIVALDATGRIDATVLPVGVGPDVATIQTEEALDAGMLVNIYSASGYHKCRRAVATAPGYEAHGFVLEAVAYGGTATVYFEGNNTALTGLSPGVQYLSDTPGEVRDTAPSGPSYVVQRVGVSYAPTAMNFEPAAPIVLEA